MPLTEQELREGIKTDAQLLQEALTMMVEFNPVLTDINAGGKLWSFFYVSSLQKAAVYYLIYLYRKQSFVMSATGRYLDLHAEERGVTRKPAVSAGGKGYFTRNNPAPRDYLVPAGQQISTVRGLRGEQVFFVTLEDAIIEGPEDFSGNQALADSLNAQLLQLRSDITSIDGQLLQPDLTPVEKTALGKQREDKLTEVEVIENRFNGKTKSNEVMIQAVDAGVDGNLLENTLSEIVDPPTGVHAFFNYATSGGLDEESDEDLRFRIMHGREARSKSTRAAIEFSVLSIPGVRKVMIRDPSKTGRGAFDLIVVPYQIPMTDALRDEVTAVVDDVRSAGIEVLFEDITEVRIDMKLSANFDNSVGAIDTAAQDLDFKKRVNTYFNGLDIGESAYMEKVGAAINSDEIDGLRRATITEISVNSEVIYSVSDDTTSPYILQIEPEINQVLRVHNVEITYE